MKRFEKFVAAGLAITLLSVPFSNVAMAASEAKVTLEASEFQIGDSLRAVWEEDNVSKEEVDKFVNYANTELSKGGEFTVQWKLAGAKKIIKFVVDNKEIVPGKTLRGWVDKYGSKMIDAIDNLEVASKAGLQLAFEEAGIPKNVAKALADFIVTFLL
ncbi:hypothetical protein SFC66_04135 [Terribacillus saccharophilus]|uniref:hypothetical protein n=1 Tax=Terribacillus saccharophilus TaxID=361277 RepID=UPI003982A2D9